jgi:hypothetical protein
MDLLDLPSEKQEIRAKMVAKIQIPLIWLDSDLENVRNIFS